MFTGVFLQSNHFWINSYIEKMHLRLGIPFSDCWCVNLMIYYLEEFFLIIKVIKRTIFKPRRKGRINIAINVIYNCITFDKSLNNK